ncbi:unnamed protein product [Ectocarpus fasciculatus]
MLRELLTAAILAVLRVSVEEDFQSGRTKKWVAILDPLAYGTWKCCWWLVNSVQKTVKIRVMWTTDETA